MENRTDSGFGRENRPKGYTVNSKSLIFRKLVRGKIKVVL